MIELKNVSLQKEGRNILSNLHWKVEKGEKWAILGMNGAGKTTLLNVICGYLFPTTGEVRVLGKIFGRAALHEVRKNIGLVSVSLLEKMENHAHLNALTVVISGKYASIGLYDDPGQKEIERAVSLLKEFGIATLQHRAFGSLSQGEKQRVLIARALMGGPQLLILDEPCAGLDFLAKAQLLTAVERLAEREGMTVLYVTHHLDEISPSFTKSLLLKQGRIFSQGPTERELTSEKLSAFCETPVTVDIIQGRYSLSAGAHPDGKLASSGFNQAF